MIRREWLGCVAPVLASKIGWADEIGNRATAPRILQAHIPLTQTRKELTLQYIRTHYNPKATTIAIDPKVIVVHWTAGSTTESALATFAPERIPTNRPELVRGGYVNVSAHFLVSQDGTIRQLLPVTVLARHVIGMNHVSIGIENVGGPKMPLTLNQMEANKALIRHLVAQLPSIRFLIGHSESNFFRGTPLWRELVTGYQGGNIDPGLDFIEKLRSELVTLGLRARFGN